MSIIDPPNCGCGFMSANRLMALLSSSFTGSLINEWEPSFVILPSLRFNCSGNIVKWTIGGIYRPNGGDSLNLQIWRRMGNSTSVYERVNGRDTVLTPSSNYRNDVFELIPNNPIPVEPGDVIGVYVPQNRPKQNLNLVVENSFMTPFYYFPYFYEELIHMALDSGVVDITTMSMSYRQPLISAEVCK